MPQIQSRIFKQLTILKLNFVKISKVLNFINTILSVHFALGEKNGKK